MGFDPVAAGNTESLPLSIILTKVIQWIRPWPHYSSAHTLPVTLMAAFVKLFLTKYAQRQFTIRWSTEKQQNEWNQQQYQYRATVGPPSIATMYGLICNTLDCYLQLGFIDYFDLLILLIDHMMDHMIDCIGSTILFTPNIWGILCCGYKGSWWIKLYL